MNTITNPIRRRVLEWAIRTLGRAIAASVRGLLATGVSPTDINAMFRGRVAVEHTDTVTEHLLILQVLEQSGPRWQTSKETAYVEASRARHGTEWYLARDELGADGQDERRVRQLAGMMRQSRAQTASLAHAELPDPAYGLNFDRVIAPSRSRLPGLVRALSHIARPDRSPERSIGGR